MSDLSMTQEGDRDLVFSRTFQAAPEVLFRAHTEAELLQQWVLGPDGWSMPVCVSDARPGGAIRFEWVSEDGSGFHLTGEYLELQPFRRIVHVERMFLPDPTPDNRVETVFDPHDGGTLLTMRMTLPDKATREAMLAEGMMDGMKISYDRIDALLQRSAADGG
jgi:uncharacterized protein YndB with AHSA1/START domain